MKVLVIGASTNPDRYSNRAIKLLNKHNHEVIALGLRKGEVDGITIQTDKSSIEPVHTVTMYVGARNQPEYYDFIKNLEPKRVIFNPGAENPELEAILKKAGVTVENACTLVMLNMGIF